MRLPEDHSRSELSAGALAELRRTMARLLSSARARWSPEDLCLYSFDGTRLSVLPDVVAQPLSTAEVAEVLRYANDNRVPVCPRGAASGLTGGAVPVQGGILLDLSLMNRILEINEADQYAVAQPGVLVAELQRAVEARGLFYPPDPASSMMSTLGGNVAENAGGLRALKYGVTRDYVLELEAVLASGEVLRFGRRTVKTVTGYDVVRLLVGSEGTLAVVTEITVKLIAAPEAAATALAAFRSCAQALAGAAALVRKRVLPRACEFIDARSIEITRRNAQVDLPAQTAGVLLVETDGPAVTASADLERAVQILRNEGAFEIVVAKEAADREKLWDFRRAVSPALQSSCAHRVNEDICVPRSRLVEMLAAIEAVAARYGVDVANFGHAGDGNIHVNLLPKDERELDAACRAAGDICREAVRLGGTLSGEHGIGLTKRDFLPYEISTGALALMRRLKSLFDPNGILNPGKIFPPEGPP
ncbi:MAG: FAD-linked oxidase C-terminal domain-containing protein [Planctomycetota bacterium]